MGGAAHGTHAAPPLVGEGAVAAFGRGALTASLADTASRADAAAAVGLTHSGCIASYISVSSSGMVYGHQLCP